jgi:ribosome biogenesis GTPase
LDSLTALGWSPLWADRFAPHAAAGCIPGRICAEHRELYQFCAAGGEGSARVSGRLRHDAGSRTDFPAVGDWVALLPQQVEGPALIQALLPRINKFSRKAPGEATTEQVVAANLDTLLLVTSLNQDLNLRRIERYLTAAALPGCQTVLVLNKSDLCDQAAEVVERFRACLAGVPVHAVSARTGEGIDALAGYLGTGRTVALLGSSGVGKSSLLNRLADHDRQAVQSIREADDRGRHTTTHREMFRLAQGGLLIDNPGMRELQLWDAEADLDSPFADIAEAASRCRYADCRHEQEPGCAVRQAIDAGLLDPERLESYRKLGREMEYLESRQDGDLRRQRKDRERRIHRIYRAMNRKMRRHD